MGNCCCLVGGKKKGLKSSKRNKATVLDHDYDDDDYDYDVDECLATSSSAARKNIRRGGGCNRSAPSGPRRPKNSKNNKNFLATYLATDLANNSNSSKSATKPLMPSSVERPANENANVSSAGLLSQSANTFVDNMLHSNGNARASQELPFPQPQKSTITYYQNMMSVAHSNNASSGINSMSGSGKLLCGVSSNSSSSMLSSTPSRRGCDNSQVMNNLNKGDSFCMHFKAY